VAINNIPSNFAVILTKFCSNGNGDSG